jgi:squalene monooxygenase
MSNFVGVIIHNCSLPYPNHGHVFLAKTGPVLGYQVHSYRELFISNTHIHSFLFIFMQIGTNDIRILVDIPSPLPSAGNGDLAKYLTEVTAPQLPVELRPHFLDAVNAGEIRSMTNSKLHPNPEAAIQNGCLMLGDAWNMRHPLTGGGMTVCFSDVKVIRDIFKKENIIEKIKDRTLVRNVLSEQYVRGRKPAAVTINILAAALYGVFAAADDPMLPAMREACFAYFKLGGKAVSGPMSLLSGLCQSPAVLMSHFFAVAVFGCLRTIFPFPTPYRILQAWRLLAAAAWIVIPLLKGERVLTPFASFLSFVFAAHAKQHVYHQKNAPVM